MPETVKPVLIYCTFPEIGAAEKAGEDLVRRDLCACVNIWPGVTSVYRWEGTIERASEVVMIIKTRSAYLEWIMQNSNPPPGQWPPDNQAHSDTTTRTPDPAVSTGGQAGV